MNSAPTPAHGTATPPASSKGGVMTLLGRVVAVGLIGAAGFGGWVAIETFDVALPNSGNGTSALAASLPELGDGLPEARLQSPAPWRQFSLTYQDLEQTNRFWIDLDSWRLRVESANLDETSAVEIYGDQSYLRAPGTAEWAERDVQQTRELASWLMSGIGPFVLTDLVPPNTLGFTTLELEGTSRDERVYEVVVDAATLQEQHPLAHQRWAAATRIVNDTSGVYRIRVRDDGYIVRIDGETSSVQWDPLEGGVVFFSPLAQSAELAPATVPSTVDTTPDGAPVPTEASVPPAAQAPAADN